MHSGVKVKSLCALITALCLVTVDAHTGNAALLTLPRAAYFISVTCLGTNCKFVSLNLLHLFHVPTFLLCIILPPLL